MLIFCKVIMFTYSQLEIINYTQFQNNYLSDKIKEYESKNKELRDEAEKKTTLLEEVDEKDRVK